MTESWCQWDVAEPIFLTATLCALVYRKIEAHRVSWLAKPTRFCQLVSDETYNQGPCLAGTESSALSITLYCLPRWIDLFPIGLGDYFDLLPLWPLSPLLDKLSEFWYGPFPGSLIQASIWKKEVKNSVMSQSEWFLFQTTTISWQNRLALHAGSLNTSHWTNYPGQAASSRGTGARLLCDREEARAENHMEKAVAIRYRGCLLSWNPRFPGCNRQ